MTPDESVSPDEIKACDEFDTSVEENLGPAESAKDFESGPENVTTTLDQYEDDEEHQTHMPDVDEILSEAMENYFGA